MAGDRAAVKVHIDHVVKKFQTRKGEMTALNGVDLDIHENEFITVVGPSGCGKSTLLNIIGGLESPTEGQVTVDGKPVDGPSPERGIVFQQYALFPWLTVIKNVMFGLKLQGKSKEEAEEIAHKYLKMVELEDFANHYPKELSGGMKQRVTRYLRVTPPTRRSCLWTSPSAPSTPRPAPAPAGAYRDLGEGAQDLLLHHPRRGRGHHPGQPLRHHERAPGRVKDIIDIDIPYPRDQATKMSPRFLELKNEIWGQVYQEYLSVRK